MKVIQNEAIHTLSDFWRIKDVDIIGMVNGKDFFIRYMDEIKKFIILFLVYASDYEVMERTNVTLLLPNAEEAIPCCLYVSTGGNSRICNAWRFLEEDRPTKFRANMMRWRRTAQFKHVTSNISLLMEKVLFSEVKEFIWWYTIEEMMWNQSVMDYDAKSWNRKKEQHVWARKVIEFKCLEKRPLTKVNVLKFVRWNKNKKKESSNCVSAAFL